MAGFESQVRFYREGREAVIWLESLENHLSKIFEKLIWHGKGEAPSGIVGWVSHCHIVYVTTGSFERFDIDRKLNSDGEDEGWDNTGEIRRNIRFET